MNETKKKYLNGRYLIFRKRKLFLATVLTIMDLSNVALAFSTATLVNLSLLEKRLDDESELESDFDLDCATSSYLKRILCSVTVGTKIRDFHIRMFG